MGSYISKYTSATPVAETTNVVDGSTVTDTTSPVATVSSQEPVPETTQKEEAPAITEPAPAVTEPTPVTEPAATTDVKGDKVIEIPIEKLNDMVTPVITNKKKNKKNKHA